MSHAIRSSRLDPHGDLAALAESIGEGVALCSAGKIRWANRRLAEILGRGSVQDLVGERFHDFFEDAGFGLPSQAGGRVLDCRVEGAPESSPRIRVVRVDYPSSRQETLWVASPYAVSAVQNGAPRVDEPHDLFGAETRKRKELLDFVGHELRAPLTVIQGYNSLLLSDAGRGGNSEQLRILQEIDRNCAKMGELLERLEHDNALGLSPCASVHLEAACLEKTIQHALRRVKPALSEARVEVDLKLDLRTARFLFDPFRIEQVFVNLLENATRYAAPGSVEIASCSVERNAERFVEISVSDRGPGVPAGERERIFDSGVRLEGGNNFPGSGLGLYISRQIVSAHGGDMVIVDRPGGGSSFVISLPWVPSRTA